MTTTRRTRAREVALQLLFQRDQNAVPVPRAAIQRFAFDRTVGDRDTSSFALELYDGVLKHRESLDQLLGATAEKWRVARMMPVDRNVLRLGAYELLHGGGESPVPVVLNEAIELARRFATADSAAFVNGILDKIARTSAERKTENPGP